MKWQPLFYVDGIPVFKGQRLYHHNINLTGGIVLAEFPAEGEMVTVRSDPSGAVPTVRVSELKWTPAAEELCPTCRRPITA